jgi:uncharacterized membrane protein
MYPQTNRNFDSNKILGGVGCLLAAIGSLIFFSGSLGILYIIGIILVLVAMRGLSDDFRDRSIYGLSTGGFILSAIGIIVGIIAFDLFIIRLFRDLIASHVIIGIFGLIIGLVALFVAFIFLLLSAVSYRRAFNVLAGRSGEKMFRTGGLLLLIGSALVIVLAGFTVMFVAWMLLAVAFFSMRAPYIDVTPTYTAPPPPPPTGAATGQVKYCSTAAPKTTLTAPTAPTADEN